MNTLEISDRDFELATDVADTILHARQDCESLPTIEAMKFAISTDVKTRKCDNRLHVMLMSQDIIREADEWYNKESQPEQ